LQDGKQLPPARELADRVVRMGGNGLGRVEIAAQLGAGLAGLARMEARSGRLAHALARAAEAELAWWEALPREALAAVARFDMGAWSAAMRWRFGWAGSGAGEGSGFGPSGASGAGARAGVGTAEGPARPRAIYLLPDNGKERRTPDGAPMTPAMRRAHALKPAVDRIAALEGELARWRGILADMEAEHDRAEAEDDGWEDEDDWEGDDGVEDDGVGRRLRLRVWTRRAAPRIGTTPMTASTLQTAPPVAPIRGDTLPMKGRDAQVRGDTHPQGRDAPRRHNPCHI